MSDTLSELAERYRQQGAPDSALNQAVANFTAHQRPPRRWPVIAAAAAVLCAVLLLPALQNEIRESEQAAAAPRLASLSLNQLSLPSRVTVGTTLSISTSPGLASITRLSIPAPNLNQLSAARGQN